MRREINIYTNERATRALLYIAFSLSLSPSLVCTYGTHRCTVSTRRGIRTRSLFHHTLLRVPSFKGGSEKSALRRVRARAVDRFRVTAGTAGSSGPANFSARRLHALDSHLAVAENPPDRPERSMPRDVHRDFRSVSRAPRVVQRGEASARRELVVAARISR